MDLRKGFMEQASEIRPTIYIYALCEPCGKVVRYVGQSSKPKHRYKGHLSDDSKTHKVHWVQSVLARGEVPVLKILARIKNCTEAQWKRAERRWIKRMADKGHRLTNSDPGGIGATLSPETRRRIGEKLKGHIVTEETRRKLSLCRPNEESRKKMSRSQRSRFKTWKFSSAAIERIRLAVQGRRLSQETRQKLSLHQKNRKRSRKEIARLVWMARNKSEETRRKISAGNKGKKRTPEQLERLSAAMIGRKVNKATREKIRATLTGRPHSPERIAALTRGQRKRRAREHASKPNEISPFARPENT